MTQNWDYKNRVITPVSAIDPIIDPIQYRMMIDSPKNAYELSVALNDARSEISKKETELLRQAEEIRVNVILIKMCEYAEFLRTKSAEKEAMLHDWRSKQVAEEELRRQFAKPSDAGMIKHFDKVDLSTISDAAKLSGKFYEVAVELKQSQQRMQVLNDRIEKLNSEAVVINEDWRTAKAVELENQIQLLKQHNYTLTVMVRDEQGRPVKELDQYGHVKKDRKGRDKYVFRSVSPDSEEGRRVLDAFHVLPSTSSDLKDDHKGKDEYAISRRLQALLLSYDVAVPAPLEKTKQHTLRLPDHFDTNMNQMGSEGESKKAIPAPPKPPKKPPQKAIEKVQIDFDQFFKREQLEEAFQVLFTKTRGGFSREELTNISSEEMLALLREEYSKNKFKMNLQNKPSPATLKALTEALHNALAKYEAIEQLANEQETLNKNMKKAAEYAQEFSNRGLGTLDYMKLITGTEQEKTQLLENIIAIKDQTAENKTSLKPPVKR